MGIVIIIVRSIACSSHNIYTCWRRWFLILSCLGHCLLKSYQHGSPLPFIPKLIIAFTFFLLYLSTNFIPNPSLIFVFNFKKETLLSKYSSKIETTLEEMEELGCNVMHGVNVMTMDQHPILYRTSTQPNQVSKSPTLTNSYIFRLNFKFVEYSLIWFIGI